MQFRWKWIVRGCELLAAAIVLLVLTQLHTAIVQNALTLVGGRTDVPLVDAVKDRCNTQLVPLAWRSGRTESAGAGPDAIKVCDNNIEVYATAPLGQFSALLVNDSIVTAEPQPRGAPFVVFRTSRLRPGINELVLLQPTDIYDFPLAAPSGIAGFEYLGGRAGYWRTRWGRVPIIEASYRTRIVLDSGRAEQSRQGPYTSAEGWSWMLVQGQPGEAVHSQPHDLIHGETIGPDGFEIVQLAQAPGPQQTVPDLAWSRRELTLSLENVGTDQKGSTNRNQNQYQNTAIRAALTACLAPDHPLVAWARENLIEAPELIARLTGFKIGRRLQLSEGIALERNSVTVEPRNNGAPCTLLQAQYAVIDGVIEQALPASFLKLKGDQLVLDGLSSMIRVIGQLPDKREADRMIWYGGASLQKQPPLLQPISSPQTRRLLVSRAAPTQPQSSTAQSSGFFERWRRLFEALPGIFQSFLWGFAVAVPVALIYWALRLHRDRNPQPELIDRACAGLMALLAFMTALALQPILFGLTSSAVNLTDLWPILLDDAQLFSPDSGFSFAPIAFVVVLVIFRVLPKYPPAQQRQARTWIRLMAALISLLLVGIAISVALLDRYIAVDPKDILPPLVDAIGLNGAVGGGEFAAPIAIGAIVVAWCVLGLLTFWIPVFWLARSAMRWGPLARTSLFAAALTFFVPLIAPGLGFLRILLGADSLSRGGFVSGSVILSAAVALGSIAGVVIMVTLVLCSFREIAFSMLEQEVRQRKYVRAWTGAPVLFIVAIAIVEPTTGTFINASGANVRLLQLMAIFQAYAALIALLAPLTAMRAINANRRTADIKVRFALDDSMIRILTVAFAGYLAYWLREPIGILILISLGWVVFKFGIIGSAIAPVDAPQPGFAQRILDYRREIGLIDARRNTVEREFTDDKIQPQEFADKRTALEAQAERLRTTLGMPIADAKRRLLGFGPGLSPLANGLLGAAVGLIVGALFQIVQPLEFTLTTSAAAEHTSTWLGVLQTLIADPNFQPVLSSDVSVVLSLVSSLLNAFAIWVLVGFLFGYSFHIIYGVDGFTKAIVFGAGIAVTYVVSRVILAHGGSVSAQKLLSFLPIFVFLIFLGSLVFDGKTLERQEVGIRTLPAIYGLKTTIGYASFAGLIAAVKPLLELFGWTLKK